jgi:hypothetical protein
MSLLVALTFVTTIEDYASIPFMSLVLTVMTLFPPKVALRGTGIFVLILMVSMIVYGLIHRGISTEWILLDALLYIASYLVGGAVVTVVRQLEAARNEAKIAHGESGELPVIVLGSLLVTLGLAELFVRRIDLLWGLFGMKRLHSEEPPV